MDVFLARQPIFDAREQLFGYELLYRHDGATNAAVGQTAYTMGADVVVKAILGVGLEALVGPARAFTNFSGEMLRDHVFDLLPKERLVVEVLETVEATPDVIAACAEVHAKGITLALDDYVDDGRHAALIPYTSIIKFDVLNKTAAEMEPMVKPFRGTPMRFLAERVETKEQRDEFLAAGFTLFQGYYYSRPEIIAQREFPSSPMAIMELLNLIRDANVTDAKIEEAFGNDPGLVHKLLRIVNSAAMGGKGVDSIRYAVQLIGYSALHKWLALIMLSSLARQSAAKAELVQTAVMRARACELLAERAGKKAQAGSLFMVGLLSTLDALLQMPMADILSHIDLSQEIKSALLNHDGPFALQLEAIEAYETGQWDVLERLSPKAGVSASVVSEAYVASLQWVRDCLATAAA